MSTKSIKHQGPQQTRVLDNDVVLLRLLDTKSMGRDLMGVIAGTRLGGDLREGEQDWFLDGYVAADQPRDQMMAAAISDNTIGFAIARSDSGEILAKFPRNEFQRADEVARTARVELAVNVALRDSERVDDGADYESETLSSD